MESEALKGEGFGEKIKSFFDRNLYSILACAAVGLVCCIYSGMLADKAMTPAEGWYSYYASLINEQGAVPYRDFELLFPPLYVYLIAFITRIFGYDIIVLRVFGVIVYMATGIFACLIFEKLFKKPLLGMIGGLLTAAFLQSEVAQVFYDYIRLMDLNVYIAVYFFLRHFDRVNYAEKAGEGERARLFDADVLVGAVFAVLASMYKQSSGLIFWLFCMAVFAFLAIFLKRKKEALKNLLVTACVGLVMYGVMFLLLAVNGAFSAYWHYNFEASVGAKGGSIFTVLFGWLISRGGLILLSLPFAALLVGLLVFIEIRSRKKETEETFSRTEKICLAAGAIGAVLVVVLCFASSAFADAFGDWAKNWRKYVSFLFCALVFLLSALCLIFPRKTGLRDGIFAGKYFYLSGTAFALGYAVSTSGSLGESQVALDFALMILSFAGFARFPKKEVISVVTAVFMLFDIGVSFSVKTQTVYSWWGLNVGSYWEQTTECDVPIFRGIKMSEKYARMYNNVYRGVLENTEEDDEIFVFPHMPILYLATGREKATYTAVQWFDVSSDEKVVADIDILREKKPKVMVLCFISDYVRDSHEESFREGEKSGLTLMQEFLTDFVVEENYAVLSSDQISDGYTVTVYCLSE